MQASIPGSSIPAAGMPDVINPKSHGCLQRQGKVWYVLFYEDGLSPDGRIIRKRRKARIGSTALFSEEEARAKANTMVQSATGGKLPNADPTVQQFVELHFLPEKVATLKAAGRQHYSRLLKRHVLPAMGSKRLSQISYDDIQKLVRLKLKAGFSTQTALHIKNCSSALIRHAKKRGMFKGDNPAQFVNLPEMKRKPKRALTLEQCKLLLGKLSMPLWGMVALAIFTSMNIAELLALRWKRVNITPDATTADGENLPPCCLAVRENFWNGSFGSVKCSTRERIVPIPKIVVEALTQLKRDTSFNDDEDLVFCNAKGKPHSITNLTRRKLKPVARELGMPWISWHVFRRTHASLEDQIGMAISDRVAMMGHSQFGQTMRYTSLDLERRRDALEQLAQNLLVAENKKE